MIEVKPKHKKVITGYEIDTPFGVIEITYDDEGIAIEITVSEDSFSVGDKEQIIITKRGEPCKQKL